MSLEPGTTLGPYEVAPKLVKAAWVRCIEPEIPDEEALGARELSGLKLLEEIAAVTWWLVPEGRGPL